MAHRGKSAPHDKQVRRHTGVHTCMQAVSLLGPGPRFYSLWPQSDVPLPWQTLLRSFYMRVASLPVAHTRAEGGQWLKPSQVVLPDNACVQVRPTTN